MKVKTIIGFTLVLLLLFSISSITAFAESEDDPGSHQQTQNRQLYRNHDEEMPGQHKEYDYHHNYGDD